jgi:glucoamylase
MLATHKTLVDSFRNLSWPVNDKAPAGQAILVGRYPEDTYYDGGAWPLCTFACAEMLYDAVAQIKRAGTLSVDSISLTFFQDLSPDVKIGNYTGQEMHAILANMSTYAEGFVRAVQVCFLIPFLPFPCYRRFTVEHETMSQWTRRNLPS